MKILICLNKDIYCLYALNILLQNLNNHQIKIYFSSKVGSKPVDNQELLDLQGIEGDLSLKNITNISQKLRDEFDYKENLLNLNQLIDLHQLEILDFKNINQDGFEYLKQHWTPDLIASIRFGQILKDPIIALPKFGIINLHSGILPNYRGILATFWSMLNSEEEIGTTLHFINDASIDTGDIISITKHKIDYKKPLMINIFRLYTSGVKSVIEVIAIITNKLPIKTSKQDSVSGKYYSYPTDNEVKKFLDLKLTLK